MALRAGQIYYADIQLGKVGYARPFLVLEVTVTDALICAISTKAELKKPEDLTIHPLDPSFSATGLSEESHLIRRSVHARPLHFFQGLTPKGEVLAEIKKTGRRLVGRFIGLKELTASNCS